jgi:hypothetical protein
MWSEPFLGGATPHASPVTASKSESRRRTDRERRVQSTDAQTITPAGLFRTVVLAVSTHPIHLHPRWTPAPRPATSSPPFPFSIRLARTSGRASIVRARQPARPPTETQTETARPRTAPHVPKRRSLTPARRVVRDLRSRDQKWGSHPRSRLPLP